MSDQLSRLVDPVRPYIEACRLAINGRCEGLEPWQVVSYTVGATVLSMWVYEFLFNPEDSVQNRVKKSFFKYMKRVPYIRNKIEEELSKTSSEMEKTFHKGAKGQEYVQVLPARGLNEEDLFKEIKRYQSLYDVKWDSGACSGTVYSGEEDLTKLMAKIYGEFAWTNPLHADVFPDVRKMEAEVVRMTCNMFNGDADTCGSMTTGGTESIMLACKAYRDLACDRGVKYPNMVVPITAHAAFDKSAQFFRIRIIHVDVDPITRRVDVNKMRRAINKNTCMIVGSAPQFPHGVLDPIKELSDLAVKYNIPLHVDSCLGGFLIPFMKKAGFSLPPFDFSCPGVTSISADTHKYGYAPKGSSVIMYKNKDYRKFQYFVQPDWPGGIYASPTIGGSRAGAIIAACWATMMYIGEEGYVQSTKKIIDVTKYIEDELAKIPGLFIYGKPEVSVVGFGSKDFNIYRLSDAMTARGWNLNALQFPASIHLCCTLVHTKPGVADRFVNDVKECTAVIMKDPKADCGGQGALYGMAQSIPDRSIVSEIAGSFFDAYYNTRGAIKPTSNGTS